jgi:hypothetical protein
MEDYISRQIDALWRAVERGDIDEQEYDRQVDQLINSATPIGTRGQVGGLPIVMTKGGWRLP